MSVKIPRIARRTILCRKEAILVSPVVAVSYILVNGMGMIRREVSPIFTIRIQSSFGGSMLLFGKGKTMTEYFNALILRTSTRTLGRPLGNVVIPCRTGPRYRGWGVRLMPCGVVPS